MTGDRADVLVIGGGVIGACVAAAVAERGAAVTLIEREPEVCPPEAAVYANCGLLVPSEVEPLAHPGALGQGLRWMLDGTSPFYVKPRASLALLRWLWMFRGACAPQVAQAHAPILRELGVASAELHDALAADGGGDGWQYRRNGWLFVWETRAGFDAAEDEAAALRSLGVASEVLTAAEVRERVPPVRAGSVAGGTLTPDDGHMDPAAFTRAMVARAERAGAHVVTGAEAYGFDANGGGVRAVRTTRGVFAADQVVLATGAWSPALARELGLRLPIEPAKGYSIDVERPDGLPDLPLCVGEAHVVLTPMGDGLRLGSTLELAGWDMRLRAKRLANLRNAAARVLGLPADGPVRQVWRGPRPLTPDGLPVIGRSRRHGNVILATGHCMLGLSLGPVTGKLVAELCAGDAPSIDLELLRPDRF